MGDARLETVSKLLLSYNRDVVLKNILTKKFVGMTGALLAMVFGVIVLILGLVQPEYNHIRDTVSMLAVGKLGWVQQINFVLLIMSMLVIVYRLKDDVWKYAKSKKGLVFFFGLCIVGVVMAVMFPTDPNKYGHRNFSNLSFLGKIHYGVTGELLIAMGGFMYQVLEAMKRSGRWGKLLPLTRYVLYFNLIFGLIWFGCNEMGWLVGYLGLFQKILITNVLVWLVAVGIRLK